MFVSDDMAWARKKISREHGDVFFVGRGEPDSDEAVGVDLALLVLSNATILSRGTFSSWAGFLNGGEYYNEAGLIVPEHVIEPGHEFYHQELKF